MNEFDTKKLAADNVRNAFRSTAMVFGPVLGFLIASGLSDLQISWGESGSLALWLFTIAAMSHNLLKLAENIVWHVPLLSNLVVFISFLISAVIVGFFQKTVALDPKIWIALVSSWVVSTLFFAFLERPKAGDWVEK